MSAPLFQHDILFFQRLLSSAGLYTGKLDGDYGPLTHNAEELFQKLFDDAAVKHGVYDQRSEGVIATLMPKAQVASRKFLAIAQSAPFTVKLLSGTRSYAEQDALARQVPKVTNAHGGQSNHNWGIAWDVGIFSGGVYYTGATSAQEKAYSTLASMIKPKMPELEWGGDWVNFSDKPHYQLKTGKTVSQVRALFEAGKPYV